MLQKLKDLENSSSSDSRVMIEKFSGHQRHLCSALDDNRKMQNTVKNRITEYEKKSTNSFNSLYRNSPIKVKRDCIRVKSPKFAPQKPFNASNKKPVNKPNNELRLSSSKCSKPKSASQNSPIVRKQKLSLVKRLFENFDSNVSTTSPSNNDSLHTECNDKGGPNTPSKDMVKNAFERLMVAKGGTQEKTPVRRRIKRLDGKNPTISGQNFMDLRNWAKKLPENEN